MSGRRIGLGCMRLSTAADRDEARSIEVIHAALDAGVTLLDTADAYSLSDADVGHNERLIARALDTWSGDRSVVEVATKGGLVRPGGAWVRDGRAKHLHAACDASRRALGVQTIDLYQLHAVDPRTPLETSVRALAALREAGKVKRIGLSNVNVGQIEAAQRIVEISSVQVSLSVFDDESLKGGVVEYCRDHGIRLIAYRPLGGERAGRLARDPLLAEVASRSGLTPQEVALAWLMALAPDVIPIPGATRVESARSLVRVLAARLDDADVERLDARFGAQPLRVPRSARKAAAARDGDVVLVMGMPGAGKSTVAQELVLRGYGRLNRDLVGGSLSGLVAELDHGLADGRTRWVLDNTYPSRKSRTEVIECAWRHGVPVRCVWVDAGLADAQINAITRLLEAHGRLPTPEELRERGRHDPRFFGPDAQFRWERSVEPPTTDEGFSDVERRPFVRDPPAPGDGRALVFDFDGVLVTAPDEAAPTLHSGDIRVVDGRQETLARYAADGWLLAVQAWRPQVARGETSLDAVQACFERARELLELEIEFGFCPHPAGPPVCWCRKPIPGLVLELASRRRVDLQKSIVVGRKPADRTMARRLGMTYRREEDFFGERRGE